MLTNAQAMACGNCGHGLFRMFSAPAAASLKLVAECAKCKSTSVIETRPAELTIEFGEGSDGCLCRMDPTS